MADFSYFIENVCLFCFRTHKQEFSVKKNGEKKSRNQKIFMFLCQMLDIHGELSAEEYDFVNDTLPLCQNCYKMFDELTSLVQQLETIETQIRNSVQGIQETIVNSTTELERSTSKGKKSHVSVFRKLVMEKDERERAQNKGSPGRRIKKASSKVSRPESKTRFRSKTSSAESDATGGEETGVMDTDFDFGDYHEGHEQSSDDQSNKSDGLTYPVIVSSSSVRHERSDQQSKRERRSKPKSVVVNWSDSSSSTSDEDSSNPCERRSSRVHVQKKTKVIDKKTFKYKEVEKYTEKGRLLLERVKECRICKEDIPTEPTARTHFKKEHPEDQAYTCPEFGDVGGCDFKTNWYGEVKKHLIRMHPIEIIEKYDTEKVEEKQTLNVDASQPRPYLDMRALTKCRVCYQQFKTTPMLVRHVKISHPGEKPFSCRFGCEFITSRPNRLRKHFLRSHPLEPLQLVDPSDVSESAPKAKTSLPVNRRKKRSREEILRMQEANRAKKAELVERLKKKKQSKPKRETATWDKQLTCRICQFQGLNDSIMMSHFSTVHPGVKAFVCLLAEEENCEFATMWRYEVRKHILRLHPDHPVASKFVPRKSKSNVLQEEAVILDNEDSNYNVSSGGGEVVHILEPENISKY